LLEFLFIKLFISRNKNLSFSFQLFRKIMFLYIFLSVIRFSKNELSLKESRALKTK